MMDSQNNATEDERGGVRKERKCTLEDLKRGKAKKEGGFAQGQVNLGWLGGGTRGGLLTGGGVSGGKGMKEIYLKKRLEEREISLGSKCEGSKKEKPRKHAG